MPFVRFRRLQLAVDLDEKSAAVRLQLLHLIRMHAHGMVRLKYSSLSAYIMKRSPPTHASEEQGGVLRGKERVYVRRGI